MTCIRLSSLMPGEYGYILSLPCDRFRRKRLMDLGLTEGTCVKCVHVSPLGDPVAYRIRGCVIALRRSEAGSIKVRIKK